MQNKTDMFFFSVILIFLIVELRLIPGGQFGFHCNDPALSYTYNGDTISWKWLMAVTISLPLAIVSSRFSFTTISVLLPIYKYLPYFYSLIIFAKNGFIMKKKIYTVVLPQYKCSDPIATNRSTTLTHPKKSSPICCLLLLLTILTSTLLVKTFRQ